MFRYTEVGNTISIELSSELHLVEQAILKSLAFLKRFEAAEDPRIKLILRELLNNAVKHGNNNTIDKKVSCTITHLSSLSAGHKRCERFRIVVQDEGPGFDYHRLDFSLPEDPKKIKNRGFLLINALSDEMRFNETGNSTSVTVTSTDESSMDETVSPMEQELAAQG